jgi:hypothetical protein
MAGTCEYSKELSGSIKLRGIFWLAAKTGQLLKKDSAAWSKYISSVSYILQYVCVCVCVCVYIYIYIYKMILLLNLITSMC